MIGDSGREVFLASYGHLFEHSPWVAERCFELGPFEDHEGLHQAMLRVLDEATEDERLALVRAHPELADKFAIGAGLTQSSAAEQASAGLDRLTEQEHAIFTALNRAYREQFGFPFVICVRLNDKASILQAMRSRLGNAPGAELREALRQVGLISRLRLQAGLETEAPS
jgi:2-oxo-4-hydroxy-4-carboxy-5-ureidoimidazoline decarboxylase